MPVADHDFTRCSIRLPQSLYEKIEAIAIANGAKINSRSQRPQLSSTLIELIGIGLQYYSQADCDVSQDHSNMIEGVTEKDSEASISNQKQPRVEPFNQILESQQQSQHRIEQQLMQIQASQQFAQADINYLYRLMSQLCNGLNLSISSQELFDPLSQSIEDQPLAASLDQWTVNHQWLCANGCFSQENFENWQNGEIRQDRQGRYWRRVELANVLGEFEIPADLVNSQIFYVLEYNR